MTSHMSWPRSDHDLLLGGRSGGRIGLLNGLDARAAALRWLHRLVHSPGSQLPAAGRGPVLL